MIKADVYSKTTETNKVELELDRSKFEYYDRYMKLHNNKFMQPTTLKIDIDDFTKEIVEYHPHFRHWGNNRLYLPRFGISLVNLNGDIHGDIDPACGALDIYNRTAKKKLVEKDFTAKTEVYNLPSLSVLKPLDDIIIRSSILLWHQGANVLPHIDVEPLPNCNLRLWGTNDPTGYVFGYAGELIGEVEPGRLYLCDTSVFHWAKAEVDWLYTFFIALSPTNQSFEWAESNLLM